MPTFLAVYPVLFELPGVGWPLQSFGVLVAAGFLVGIWLWGRLLGRYGQDPENDPERAAQVGVALLIGVMGGARLLYVVVETSRYLAADPSPAVMAALDPDPTSPPPQLDAEERALYETIAVGHDFLDDPLKVLYVWEGGLVMYGGLFGAILLGMLSARKHGLQIWNALDTGLVAGFVGQSIGRWGCLLVGDDYGSQVPEDLAHLPFPLTITVPTELHAKSLFHEVAGQTLWATQVWMSVNALIIAAVGWWMIRRRPPFGRVAAWILFHYSVTRFVIESFRGDSVRGVWFDGAISTSQLIAIPGALLGLYFFIRSVRSAKADTTPASP